MRQKNLGRPSSPFGAWVLTTILSELDGGRRDPESHHREHRGHRGRKERVSDPDPCKRTIQKYMRGVRTRKGGQTWATFLKNHAKDIWACDSVQNYDIFFRLVSRLMTSGSTR